MSVFKFTLGNTDNFIIMKNFGIYKYLSLIYY